MPGKPRMELAVDQLEVESFSTTSAVVRSGSEDAANLMRTPVIRACGITEFYSCEGPVSICCV